MRAEILGSSSSAYKGVLYLHTLPSRREASAPPRVGESANQIGALIRKSCGSRVLFLARRLLLSPVAG